MNSFVNNPTAADMVARQMIRERVQDAEHRAQVRAIRAERRASRRAVRLTSRPLAATPTHGLSWWAQHHLFPVR